jgi:hypothetical protein
MMLQDNNPQPDLSGEVKGNMKKMIFEVFVCMLLIGTFFVVTSDIVSAEDLVEGDYKYTLSNGEATLTGYTGTGGAITIPSTLGGYPTVALGKNAFYGSEHHDDITSITIPNSVTTIGDQAFFYCKFTSMTIPNSVTSIGVQAFGYCSDLSTVTIPNSVTTIYMYAFQQCTSLTTVTIPNSVITIEAYVFSDCTSLKTLTIGSSVTTIGDYAFYKCSSLTSITFLGLVAPTTVGIGLIENTPAEIRGHAYSNSNFPATGGDFHGLTMGAVIGAENKPPVVDFTWIPSAPTINQGIAFDASASSDSDGSITKYEWDWNNDGTYEESHATPTATYSWAQAGSYPVKLQVTDNGGATSTKTLSVTVSSGGGGGTNNKGTPGFELVFVIGAIAVAMLILRKKRNQ